MTTLSTAEQAIDLDALVDEVARTHKPVEIRSKNGGTCVLLSDAQWRGIEEALYLKSIPGVWEAIIEGANAPHDKCVSIEEIGWTIN